MRAQRVDEIVREVETEMVMCQRERIQTEETQNEVTRTSIVDEFQVIEETVKDREKKEKTKKKKLWNQESIVDPNILMNQYVLNINELNLIENTLQNISKVSTSSRNRITIPEFLIRSSSLQVKRVYRNTTILSTLKRLKELDFKLVVSVFIKTL